MANSHDEPAIAMDAISAAPAAAVHEQPAVNEKAQGHDDINEITAAPREEGGVLEGEEEAEKRDLEMPGQDLQQGVRDVEAITLSWSKWHLAAVLFNIWMLYFVNAMQSSILSNLIPFLTSDWESHALLTTIYVVSDAMSAAVYIPLSKIMDMFGRAQGFLFMIGCALLGLIMMAACNNLPTFCAAYVFYNIGFYGMTYCVDVITADVTSVKSRGLAYAFTSSPYIISAFAGPKAADDAVYDNMRWTFGCFAIILPFVAAPLYWILRTSLNKAQNFGFVEREKNNRTFMQSVWFYIVEFDIVGVLLFSCGLAVFYLPFDLASLAPNGWASGYIIAMIVVGFSVLCFFVVYEWKLAPKPMITWSIFSNRTVIGACLLDVTYQISYYCWNYYFSSFLMVVNDLSVAEAGYVGDTFDVVSGVLLLFVGYLIRRTGRFKWLLYIAVPLYIFAQGLMIYFRRPNQNVGYLVMCQIFISIGGSVFILIEQVAILAAVDHQHVATALALLNVVGTVGDGAGSTICGAIWQNTFAKALYMYLPEDALDNFDNIYEDIYTQLDYPVGNATRTAIQEAYGYAQTRMLAAGTGVIGLALIWMLFIKNIDVSKLHQTKGMVF
ncbi:hypothetical protein SBRCBS47491_008572 [Sporothrix bragantina]|uniref:Major facilitator superfamily (MFS) profile domain-containing protein n=1 Tax=Sporothrix bragantina TaxID=671064 RepID=A0ABP0CQF1_9PEZI